MIKIVVVVSDCVNSYFQRQEKKKRPSIMKSIKNISGYSYSYSYSNKRIRVLILVATESNIEGQITDNLPDNSICNANNNTKKELSIISSNSKKICWNHQFSSDGTVTINGIRHDILWNPLRDLLSISLCLSRNGISRVATLSDDKCKKTLQTNVLVTIKSSRENISLYLKSKILLAWHPKNQARLRRMRTLIPLSDKHQNMRPIARRNGNSSKNIVKHFMIMRKRTKSRILTKTCIAIKLKNSFTKAGYNHGPFRFITTKLSFSLPQSIINASNSEIIRFSSDRRMYCSSRAFMECLDYPLKSLRSVPDDKFSDVGHVLLPASFQELSHFEYVVFKRFNDYLLQYKVITATYQNTVSGLNLEKINIWITSYGANYDIYPTNSTNTWNHDKILYLLCTLITNYYRATSITHHLKDYIDQSTISPTFACLNHKRKQVDNASLFATHPSSHHKKLKLSTADTRSVADSRVKDHHFSCSMNFTYEAEANNRYVSSEIFTRLLVQDLKREFFTTCYGHVDKIIQYCHLGHCLAILKVNAQINPKFEINTKIIDKIYSLAPCGNRNKQVAARSKNDDEYLLEHKAKTFEMPPSFLGQWTEADDRDKKIDYEISELRPPYPI
ncbi:uncharacterized protein TRIADDRAFT_57931 [Trichoplax adhaerens]|uniref:Uncharacterized protein n=1 Tax=Trichoplax adhaerens TaxID=10228 RepID=B3S255_TRIAD|nr:predicted protein [Trichoplax adhaerens]EDV23374.1 predicted protein [Trichoplax adhaerens]|eukprot:XP_002114284.1 predicted protein [Trichoplax adhaerens]